MVGENLMGLMTHFPICSEEKNVIIIFCINGEMRERNVIVSFVLMAQSIMALVTPKSCIIRQMGRKN